MKFAPHGIIPDSSAGTIALSQAFTKVIHWQSMARCPSTSESADCLTADIYPIAW